MAEKETWRTYPDIPFIEASNLGRIRTKDRWVSCNGGKRLVKGRVLKQRRDKDGYMHAHTTVNGKPVDLRVSRAVAITFIPNQNNLPQVNHIDCDRTNNRVDNLEWCTPQYNTAYRDKLGHYVNNNPGHPVIAVDLETSDVFWFESQGEAARQLGLSQGNIWSVIKGRYKKTCGCWFCYADSTAVEKTRFKFGDEIADKVERLLQEHL